MHYLVMPHLEGQTLAARLERGPLPLDQALTIAAEIADALDKAHRQGIIHRDLKPANIMLTRAGSKLLDFGLAKLRPNAGPLSLSGMTGTETAAPNTALGTILGTVQYMAPEQLEGREADRRSDYLEFVLERPGFGSRDRRRGQRADNAGVRVYDGS
jgi:serine/threonine protein kinase